MYAQPVSEIVERPIEWLCFGRLALGKLTLFDGDPGLGKTWVALDLCARLSRGVAWPVEQVAALAPPNLCEQSTTTNSDGRASEAACSTVLASANSLIFSAEDNNGDTVKPRLRALGADTSRTFVWPGDRPWPRLPGGLEQFKQEIVDTQAKLVVLDPLAAFLEPGSAFTNERARHLMEQLSRLAEECRCAMLLMRHLSKIAQRGALYRGMGPMAFMGVCRLPWFVARDPQRPDVAILATPKNNLAPEQPSLAFRVNKGAGPSKIEWLGVSPHSADSLTSRRTAANNGRRERARKFVVHYLTKHGPSWATAIIHAGRRYHYSKRTLQRARKDAEAIHERIPSHGRIRAVWRLACQELPEHLRPAERHDLDDWLKKLK
jgi:putative DNA primase/helicase